MGGKAEKMDPVWDDLDRTMVGRFRTKSVAAGFANEGSL
ncbi:hypothetical protein A1F94_009580 [Pyrenophora tritici-repentis]|nr:hypothetical protein PtrV1_11315 [Pyrenophora tritici-repentis]KAF7443486.1 hypothetical protein A1F99_115600 [Pyrenophora tritici-repentis]KAG9379224.1 hypothetical protein A1F94_009580 [Pyrenophora tritici-repentis]KAI2475359.1 hypothetical protein Ptr902_13206 [Pyrenophora tritici-repentis]